MITGYCNTNSSPLSQIIVDIRHTTDKHPSSHMMLPINIVNLMSILVRISKPQRCLEIGAFTGQISAAIATSLFDAGRLISIEEDQNTYQMLVEHIDRHNLRSKIYPLHTEGFIWLKESKELFDFILLDARKESYVENYDNIIDHLSSGALLIIDNVLCRGKVLSPERNYEIAMNTFNRQLANDLRMKVAMLSIRDGLTIAQKQ